jgi:hypothetical protein
MVLNYDNGGQGPRLKRREYAWGLNTVPAHQALQPTRHQLSAREATMGQTLLLSMVLPSPTLLFLRLSIICPCRK